MMAGGKVYLNKKKRKKKLSDLNFCGGRFYIAGKLLCTDLLLLLLLFYRFKVPWDTDALAGNRLGCLSFSRFSFHHRHIKKKKLSVGGIFSISLKNKSGTWKFHHRLSSFLICFVLGLPF
jgi:hypothetical protein